MGVFRFFITLKAALEVLVGNVHRRLPGRQFLLAASAFVGLTAGIAAVVLKKLVHVLHALVSRPEWKDWFSLNSVLFPTLGLLLTVWYVKRFNRGKLGRGAANILYAIARKSSFLPKDQMYSHVFSSALTVGFGGSVGLESPIVSTGAAIGSNFARTYKIPERERTILLACGAAAGIGAVFNAPIAGVLFAAEVLLADLTLAAFVPLLMASAIGALCAEVLLGKDVVLNFELIQQFRYQNVPGYMLLGVFCGLVSWYYARVFMKVERRVENRPLNPYVKALVSGLLLGGLIMVFPVFWGEGYAGINTMASLNERHLFSGSILEPYLHGGWFWVAMCGILLFKPVAAALTVGSGGNGGNFAPSLLMGATAGFIFSSAIRELGFYEIPLVHFTLAGMAGLLSGVFHAPMSAIFLIAEITGGYELMIPLMIVSAVSFAVSKYMDPLSIEARKLRRMGQLLPSDRDTHVLNSLRTTSFVDTRFVAVAPGDTLSHLVSCISNSSFEVFPVMQEGRFYGVVYMDAIREVLFRPELYKTVQVKELMQEAHWRIGANEEMSEVMRKFDASGWASLPVFSGEQFLGFVFRNQVLEQYRTVLRNQFGTN